MLTNISDLLPVGSIVRLRGGEAPMLITAVCTVYKTEEMARGLFFDYSASTYPEGLQEDNVYYFNHENIEEIIFKGMETEEFLHYLDDQLRQVAKARTFNLYDFGKV